MSYLVNRNGTYWFQIRVPAPLVDRFGTFIRQNLQTHDRGIAQALAYRLASHWLQQFAVLRMGLGQYAAMSLPIDPQYEVTPFTTQPVIQMMPPDAAQSQATGQPKLNTMMDLYRYWEKINPDCTSSTYHEVTATVKEFQKVVRRCSPSQLLRTDITHFRDALIARKLARSTVSKKITFISTLLQTAFDAGLLQHNVARGLRVPRRKVAPAKRRAFTHEELDQIFTSPVYAQHRRYAAGGGEAAAWIPLLSLATGARLEEICQLLVSDISVDAQHGPLMHITDEGEGQRVKTAGSRRTIPIHPKLVDAGLLAYCNRMRRHKHVRLFPDLEPDHDGRYGGNFGKWFSRYLRSANGCYVRDKTVVFHSFRHTFKTLCREAGLLEEVHDALTGHVSSGVGRSYGHVPVATLEEAIRRIEFPVTFPVITAQENAS